MSESTPASSPLPEPNNSTPPEPASSKRPWTILGRLSKAVREQNWFAVALELVIVVLGVLIAFQVTDWGQARSDRAKEQTYLRQLVADLRETERLVADSNAENAPWDRASARLLQSYRMPERPPRDSLRQWVGGIRRLNRVRPVIGTASGLVATGDLDLIRSDSLRSAITAYLERNQRQLMAVEGQIAWFIDAMMQLGKRIDPLEAAPASESPETARLFAEAFPYARVPEGPHRTPFPIEIETFYQDRVAYASVESMVDARRYVAINRLLMLHRARALREQIEAELDG